MRKIASCFLLGFMLVAGQTGLAGAQSAGEPSTSTISFRGVSISPIAEEIDKVLRSDVSVDFHEDLMANVLEELSADHGFSILIHDSARDYGLVEDTLVTFRVQNIPLVSVLENILESSDCTIAIHNDVLKVVSNDYAQSILERRVYDCSSLLEKLQSGDARQNTSRVLEVLINSVDPESWEENGGYGGISEIDGKLVIAQTLRNHLMTERLLTTLDRELVD